MMKGKLSIDGGEKLSIKIDSHEISLKRLTSINLKMEAPNEHVLTLSYKVSDVDVKGVELTEVIEQCKE